VGVDIDEAWGDDEARGVNHAGRSRVGSAQGGDAAVTDGHVRAERGRAGAVDDAAIAEEEVEVRHEGG